MDIRRLQGWALVASAVIGLLGLLGVAGGAFKVLFLIGALLLIFGVPAIQAVQPMGTLGWIGIALVELGAIIAFVLNIMALSGGVVVNETLPVISALAGVIGRIIVGWLTTRERVFPAWVGWAFLVEGVLNLAGLVPSRPVVTALGLLVPLVGAVALIGYGLGIVGIAAFRRSEAPASARR